jgi:hypothetical protein
MLRVPLLTMLSAGLLFVAILCGADVSLYSVELGVTARGGAVEVTVDPVFVAVTRLEHAWGMCFGNVILIDEVVPAWGAEDERCVMLHEARHVDHFHALGLFTPLAGGVLPLEPEHWNWSDSSSTLAEMWLPPANLPPLWHVLTFTLL